MSALGIGAACIDVCTLSCRCLNCFFVDVKADPQIQTSVIIVFCRYGEENLCIRARILGVNRNRDEGSCDIWSWRSRRLGRRSC